MERKEGRREGNNRKTDNMNMKHETYDVCVCVCVCVCVVFLPIRFTSLESQVDKPIIILTHVIQEGVEEIPPKGLGHGVQPCPPCGTPAVTLTPA